MSSNSWPNRVGIWVFSMVMAGLLEATGMPFYEQFAAMLCIAVAAVVLARITGVVTPGDE